MPRPSRRASIPPILSHRARTDGAAMASILNILARRRDPTPPPLLLTSPALRLVHEPAADCARYDLLRRAG